MCSSVCSKKSYDLCAGWWATWPKSKPPEFNEYKLPAVEYYGTPQLPQPHVDPQGLPGAEKMLRCSVSGCDVPEEDVLAGYIYPPRWPLYTLVCQGGRARVGGVC